MKYLLITIFTIVGCSTKQNVSKRDLEQLYIGSGAEQYFLPDLPTWSQFSPVVGCKINTSVKYLNYEKLYYSYGLDYEKMVQLQYFFNNRIQEYKKRSGKQEIFLDDESFLFFNGQEQILGGAKEFTPPNYKKVNLIWIDPALVNKTIAKRLKKFMASSQATSGHPIFVSRCLDKVGIEKFISKHGFGDLGIKVMPTHMFSPYNKFLKLGARYTLRAQKLLKGKEVIFFAPYETHLIKEYKTFKKY
ncbi:MAG: hypothetical protein N4A33_06315 [Bacteriovoracaceae bacterium]|jgi:hypothetical protein|nr:hypothetical protein [Bacteriovoracaceae bacterium]